MDSISLDNLLEAQTFNGRIPLLVGDIGDLPFAPQTFDHVICRGVLHHLPDIGDGLCRLFDVVKAGRDLVIAEPVRDSYVLHLLRVMVGLCSAETYTVREWIEAAQAAGFRTVSAFHLGYLALPLLGRPEDTYVMRLVPFRMFFARLLLRLDNLIARLPYVRTHSWQAIFHFKKPVAPRSNT